MSFDGLVIKNKVLLESICRIERHLDVVVEVLEVHKIVDFQLCPDEEFIEFW